MIITLYNILFYYEKVVVKFYNCIKQLIKKIIKMWWLNFIYSELKLRQLKTSLLMYIMTPESYSMNVNCDSYN